MRLRVWLLAVLLMATKLYFASTGSAAVSPTINAGAEWEHVNSARLPMSVVLGSSSLANTAYSPDAADDLTNKDAHVMQFVSTNQFAGQTIASQTVTGQFQCFESNAGNNVALTLKIFACSADGSTIRSPAILSITRDGSEMNTALRNISLSVTTTACTISDGDRLVVELGCGGTCTAASGVQGHNSTIRFGESASSGDLPVDETTTATTYRPWMNFANTLANHYEVVANSGSYSLSGSTGTLQASRALDAAPGSYALTGVAATLLRGYVVSVDAGAYTISGNPATLVGDRVCNALAGEYSVSGSAATLLADYLLNAAPENYVVAGLDTSLLAARLLTADAGAYTIEGSDAELVRGFALAADSGIYVLTGADAYFVVEASGYTLNAESGLYSVSGLNASLVADRLLNCAPGVYVVTGAGAEVLADRLCAALPGAYTLTGAEASTVLTRLLTADSGDYTVIGTDAALRLSDVILSTTPGVYIVAGAPATATLTLETFPSSGGSAMIVND